MDSLEKRRLAKLRLSTMEEDEGRIGLFAGWNRLYLAVVVYTAILICLLYLLTVLLDHSVQ